MSEVQSQRKDLEWLQGVLRGPQGRMWSKTYGNWDWPRLLGTCRGGLAGRALQAPPTPFRR